MAAGSLGELTMLKLHESPQPVARRTSLLALAGGPPHAVKARPHVLRAVKLRVRDTRQAKLRAREDRCEGLACGETYV